MFWNRVATSARAAIADLLGVAGGEPVVDERRLGRELHEEICAAFQVESSGWAAEVTGRVMARLNAQRDGPALSPVVFWSSAASAFTLLGEYVYISRELLQRLSPEAAVAFVLAHEAAHHDLGHVSILNPDAISRFPLPIRLLAAYVERALSNPELEAAADDRAIELCERAGYARADCLEAFRILEALLLDRGQVDGVFGPRDAPEGDASAWESWLSTASEWLWQRRNGYLSLRDRRARLTQPST